MLSTAMELTRFRERIILWEKGAHNEKAAPDVSRRVLTADRRTGPGRLDTGRTDLRVRALFADDPKLDQAGYEVCETENVET